MSTNNHTSKNASTNNHQQSIDPTELPEVSFEGSLWEIAQGIGHVRELIYDGFGGGTVFGPQSSYDANLKGVLGELAVAKFVDDLVIEDVTVMNSYGDPGWDLELGSWTIEVKTTGADYPLPDLIIPAKPEPVADIYILAHRISERSVRLIGMATRDQVLAQPVEREPGTKRNHIVPPEELQLFR